MNPIEKDEEAWLDEIAIDQLTWRDIKRMLHNGAAEATCEQCGAIHQVEPDAAAYDCPTCSSAGTVSSPLIKLELL
jgi:hypothetical protein